MSTHANMVKMTVSSVGADPYTITLNAASSGFQSFADAYGANATVDILITQGTVWEVARNCTYTHSGTTVTRGTLEDSSTGSRITTFDNTAVVSVVATADSGRRWDSAGLATTAASVTTADVTGVVGTMHYLDLSGLTAARNFTLPAVAAVDDRVGVYVSAGCTTVTRELILKANTGDTLNGVSAAEWSRVFITGECVIMRCVVANTTWVVEYDGRIPCIAGMLKTSSTTVANTTETKIAVNESIVDNAGGQSNTSSTRIDIRRAGNYQLQGNLSASGVAITGSQVRIHKDAAYLTLSSTDLPAAGAQVVLGLYPLVVGNYLELYARHASGGNRDYYGATADSACSIRIMEVI